MPDQRASDDGLPDELHRQGLCVEPQRFEAFARAHRLLLEFTEHLRQRSQCSVRLLGGDDDR